MIRKLVITDDGSVSFYVEGLNETYHSKYGAIQESQHVFIDAGLRYFAEKSNLHILEIGWGTGLNALLTFIANENLQHDINYLGIEAYPLTMEEVAKLNYAQQLKMEELQNVFLQMHTSNWGVIVPIVDQFSLTKLISQIEDFRPKEQDYDLIYFDAFAPSVQPQLWTNTVFERLFNSLKSGGILVTYCAKGSVKRMMKEVGFKVESLRGPRGKREMTRAIKV